MVHFSTIQEFFKMTVEKMKDNRTANQEKTPGFKYVVIRATH